MEIKEAIKIIREKDKSLYEYWNNNAIGLTRLAIINYAKYLKEHGENEIHS